MKDALLIVRRNFYQSFEDIGGLLKRHFMLLIVMSIVYYVVVLLLRSVSGSNVGDTTKLSALGLYLFSRRSTKDIYQLVDQSRGLFLFMAALSSIAFWREKQYGEKMGRAFVQISANQILLLLGVLILSAILDPLFYHLYESAKDYRFHFVLKELTHEARIFVPLFLYLFTLQLKAFRTDALLNKQLLAMVLSTWFMNEFLYELMVYVDGPILAIFYDLVSDKVLLTFLLSVIMAPLMAFVLAGYATLFSFDFALLEKTDEEKTGHGLVEPSISDAGDREASI